MKKIGIITFIVALLFISCETKAASSEEASMKSQVLNLSYPCYYYTDIRGMGVDIQPEYDSKGYVLARQDSPIEKNCNVYLPPAYDSEKEYKLIFILHGVGGDENNDWLSGRPSPVEIMDNLISSGEIEPCIAVFPNGRSADNFQDRSFENQAGFYFFANELINDLIPFIEEQYSVSKNRDDRALCGLSMGGMQTINVGLCQSLKEFAWYGAFSAAPTSYSSDQIAAYLEQQNQAEVYPVKYFYNLCGLSDDIARDSHERAVMDLADKTIYLNQENFVYETMAGSHDYPVWHTGLENFLRICF